MKLLAVELTSVAMREAEQKPLMPPLAILFLSEVGV
jgi:hypothetical protein